MTLKFKTSINCGGCIAKVTPFLNGENAITRWHVNTAHPEKILTVEGEAIETATVMKVVESAGFRIQPVE